MNRTLSDIFEVSLKLKVDEVRKYQVVDHGYMSTPMLWIGFSVGLDLFMHSNQLSNLFDDLVDRLDLL